MYKKGFFIIILTSLLMFFSFMFGGIYVGLSIGNKNMTDLTWLLEK